MRLNIAQRLLLRSVIQADGTFVPLGTTELEPLGRLVEQGLVIRRRDGRLEVTAYGRKYIERHDARLVDEAYERAKRGKR